MEKAEIEKYIDIAKRRMWWIIIPFLLSILIAGGWYLKLPKIYRATTLILVQRQKVPAGYVREIVSTTVEDRIRTITEQITSRSNLENIINEFNLFNQPGSPVFMEDKIENLRKRIKVEVSRRSGRGTNAFQISFTGKNPKQVADIANALTSYFIAENMKIREDQAIGTSEFLADELETIRKKLLDKEEELKRYRERYMGGLPEQLDTNLRILGGLQQQLTTNQENLREAETRRLMIQQQLGDLAELRKKHAPAKGTEGNTEQPLDQLRAQLASLKARYTEKHPDIIRLKQKVSELESKEQTPPAAGQTNHEQGAKSTAERNLVNQLREIQIEITNLKAEATRLNSQMNVYQARVENTPKREQELMSLNRDYANIRETYNSLLSRKLEADIAVNLERKQKGEQFRILDAAKVPIRPYRQNVQRKFLMIIALGFALGCGLAYLREMMDTSFRRPEEIEDLLRIPVIASFPMTYSTKEVRRMRRNKILAFLGVGFTFVLLAVSMMFYIKGVDATVAFFKSTMGNILPI
jgi:polysaccharide chain length determinant protein (PEP-CTERM system associated)